MTRKMNAYKLYLLIIGLQRLSFNITFTIFAIYLIRDVGANPLQLVLPGTAFEATIFLFEIPTGVVADVYSRRLSVIIGTMLTGLGMLIAASTPIFLVVVIGLAIAGLGSTFISGALSAWLVDEVGQESASQAFIRATQIRLLFGFLGILFSVGLGSISLQLPIMTSGSMLIFLAIGLIFFMPETKFKGIPDSERKSWIDLFAGLRDGAKYIRVRPIFGGIFAVAFLYGGFGEAFGRLWPAIVLEDIVLPALGTEFDEIIWFGIISAGSIPITLLATEMMRRRIDLNDHMKVVRALILIFIAMMMTVLLVAISRVFALLLVGLWATGMLRMMAMPLLETWINKHTESNVRATVLSVKGQINSLGEITGGPAIGAIGTLYNVRIAISLSVVLLGLSIAVFVRMLRVPVRSS